MDSTLTDAAPDVRVIVDTCAPDAPPVDAAPPCVIPSDAWTATVSTPALPAESAPAAEAMTLVSLVINDLVYDPYSKLLYASVPSCVGASGNSIARIDPWTGSVLGSVYVGSEPGVLAASADGKYLYVGLNGADAVRRWGRYGFAFRTARQVAIARTPLVPAGP